jgi:DNA-binding FrmR family transcriptional regulator
VPTTRDAVQFNEADGRLLIHREAEEKKPLLNRLSRIEGQVKGLSQMVETDRYCGDIVQQVAATTAALREVVLLCVEDHLSAGIELALQDTANEGTRDAYKAVPEIAALLRAVIKQ